jgi:hypothetical protein
VYAHQLDLLRAHVEQQQLAATLASVMGAELSQQPTTLDEAQRMFDDQLSAPLPRLSAKDRWASDLRAALGLRG